MDLLASMGDMFIETDPVKPLINVGALYDVPTGSFLRGKYDESILNGGLGYLVGWVGIGNGFKTTNMIFQQGTAMSRMGNEAIGQQYDTETNVHISRIKTVINNIRGFNGVDVVENKRWRVIDKNSMIGELWYDTYRDFTTLKRKSRAKLERNTPFIDQNGNFFKMIAPTFTLMDSITYFQTSDTIKMSEDNALGESGANTIFMRQGISKKRLLMEVPGITAGSSDYMQISCHLGGRFMQDPRAIPKKELQFLPTDIELKGVPNDFTYNLGSFWYSRNTTQLRNDTTKAPEYPRDADDDLKGDTDLFVVQVQQLRCKSGPTGIILNVIVSQNEGVLPELTEFHHIKERGRFGLEGNMINYTVIMCPTIKLQRTNIRRKLDEEPRLRRAVNILSEIRQMYDLWKGMDKTLIFTPEQIYNTIKDAGYDWDVLLDTRGWWTLEGVSDIPFLSSMDILRMVRGDYVPYWMKNPPEAAIKRRADYVKAQSSIPSVVETNTKE